MKRQKRVWFLRDGNHLCCGLVGTAGDEYGNKTAFVNVGFGIVVWAIRRWTYEEIAVEMEEEDAARIWAEFAENRREDGVEP